MHAVEGRASCRYRRVVLYRSECAAHSCMAVKWLPIPAHPDRAEMPVSGVLQKSEGHA
jgi:hypothetical protein